MRDFESDVLRRSLIKAGNMLGLSEVTLAGVIGIDITEMVNINIKSKEGKIAAYIIRIYIKLYSMLGGNQAHMVLWMNGFNIGTGGIPAEQIKDFEGVKEVLEYLESFP